MYKLTYETPQGKQEITFETKPTGSELTTAAFRLWHKSVLPALLKAHFEPEGA